MSEFIVLGLIPGTHIQITFVLWMLLTVGFGVGFIVWAVHRAHIVRDWFIGFRLLMLTRQRISSDLN